MQIDFMFFLEPRLSDVALPTLPDGFAQVQNLVVLDRSQWRVVDGAHDSVAYVRHAGDTVWQHQERLLLGVLQLEELVGVKQAEKSGVLERVLSGGVGDHSQRTQMFWQVLVHCVVRTQGQAAGVALQNRRTHAGHVDLAVDRVADAEECTHHGQRTLFALVDRHDLGTPTHEHCAVAQVAEYQHVHHRVYLHVSTLAVADRQALAVQVISHHHRFVHVFYDHFFTHPFCHAPVVILACWAACFLDGSQFSPEPFVEDGNADSGSLGLEHACAFRQLEAVSVAFVQKQQEPRYVD